MSLHVGEAIGDYRIIGIIGAGGMGQVFQVEHKITKRKEAMKVLIADLAEETQIQRFKREIEVQAKLNHPNIAAVHNAFRLKDRLVLVLEFVEGQTLENLLKQGRLPLDTAIHYVRQVLAALAYAHQCGVIHRDVSPANLMVTEDGLVKLMDFGVAKSLGDLRLTDGGSMIGSLYYMSPEQVKGSTDPDPRSDIYSAGAILYEVVTGKKPFDYEDRFSLMVAQVEEQPRPPSEIEPKLPDGLSEIILKALAKDTGQRYPSAQEFLTALDGFTQPAAAVAPKPLSRQQRAKISEAVAGVAVLLIVALAGIGAVEWNRLNQPFPPPPPVTGKMPAAPPALAAIPPASAPEPVAAPAPEPAPKPAVAKAAPSPLRAKAPEPKPADTIPVEVEPAAAQTVARDQVEPPQAAGQTESEAQPNEPKKGKFWGKLNPFRSKNNPFKKRKADSALRTDGQAVPANH